MSHENVAESQPLETRHRAGTTDYQPADGSARDDEPALHFGLMVGESPAMHHVYDLIRKLGDVRVTVLIQGESGTGKEYAAEALHETSLPGKPFVAVNCGVFMRGLIASELFGHEKGSFTGAVQKRRGYFEQADGGTLFLDEITEMPAELQAQLLRVLESGSFVRVGGEEPVAANVRVIAATNRDPEEAVRDGRLRQDLYYRLNAFPLPIPPLRDRAEDIPLLVEYFARELRREHDIAWTPSGDLLNSLQAHHWPGNVRELKHAVYRSFLLRRRGAQHVADGVWGMRSAFGTRDLLKPGRTIAEMEKLLIISTLRHYSNDKEQAAKALGICLKTLYNRLNRYRLEDSAWH